VKRIGSPFFDRPKGVVARKRASLKKKGITMRPRDEAPSRPDHSSFFNWYSLLALRICVLFPLCPWPHSPEHSLLPSTPTAFHPFSLSSPQGGARMREGTPWCGRASHSQRSEAHRHLIELRNTDPCHALGPFPSLPTSYPLPKGGLPPKGYY